MGSAERTKANPAESVKKEPEQQVEKEAMGKLLGQFMSQPQFLKWYFSDAEQKLPAGRMRDFARSLQDDVKTSQALAGAAARGSEQEFNKVLGDAFAKFMAENAPKGMNISQKANFDTQARKEFSAAKSDTLSMSSLTLSSSIYATYQPIQEFIVPEKLNPREQDFVFGDALAKGNSELAGKVGTVIPKARQESNLSGLLRKSSGDGAKEILDTAALAGISQEVIRRARAVSKENLKMDIEGARESIRAGLLNTINTLEEHERESLLKDGLEKLVPRKEKRA
jgi:hypothetical protein